VIEETYRTERGRVRRRSVRVDLADIRASLTRPSSADRADWDTITERLLEAVGESTFAIWLSRLELIAIDSGSVMVVMGPPETLSWIRDRFARLIARCAEPVGRVVRIADERERAAMTTPAVAVSDVCMPSTKRRVS
jgi:hypothetical protein